MWFFSTWASDQEARASSPSGAVPRGSGSGAATAGRSDGVSGSMRGARIGAGRCAGRMTSLSEITQACSIAFSSSRTLPG